MRSSLGLGTVLLAALTSTGCSASGVSDPTLTTPVTTYVQQMQDQARSAFAKVAPGTSLGSAQVLSTTSCGKGGASSDLVMEGAVPGGLTATTFATIGAAFQADGNVLEIDPDRAIANRKDGQGLSIIDSGSGHLRFLMQTACGIPFAGS